MLLFILLGLFNIAAAQCGNSCNCGVTNCCQTTYSSGSPYSVFNLGNNQQYSYAQQYGSSPQYSPSAHTDAARTACLKTNPIPVSLTQVPFGFDDDRLKTKCTIYPYVLSQPHRAVWSNPFPYFHLYQSQPVFTRIVTNSNDNRQIDSICSTLFPQPDDSSTYVIYDSTVYCDGSYSITTTVNNDVGTGTFLRGNAFSSFFTRVFASVGNNINIGCSQDVYGDSGISSIFATTIGSVSPLGGGCIQQIQNIIQCVGQGPADGLYVLPYRLPTRCVTQQVCTLFNPLLYSNNNYNNNF